MENEPEITDNNEYREPINLETAPSPNEILPLFENEEAMRRFFA